MRELFSLQGSIGRGRFATLGILLVIVKWNLDRLIIAHFSDRPWGPPYIEMLYNGVFAPEKLSPPQRGLFLALLGCAVPFLWIGIALCLKRLRSMNAPQPLIVLFFVPYINLLFFLFLSLVPNALPSDALKVQPPPNKFLSRLIPREKGGAAAFGILVPAMIGLLLACFSIDLSQYGWGLFVGVPFIMGLISALVYSYHEPRSCRECISVAVTSVCFLALMLLGFAMEGAACIAMAAPIGLVLAIMGAVVGYSLQGTQYRSISTLSAAPLAVIAAIAVEARLEPASPVYTVESDIIVEASVERVWTNVVQFPEIPPPTEWYFKTGIAYPQRAVIEGRGAGAIRRCEFSTGAFIEPIEVWREPTLLGFGVTASPPPLEEWSPYGTITPAHLDGFFSATYGEFRLEKLGEGRTKLHGLTRYRQDLWPSSYWSVFSTWLIHRIHDRVLEHIKHQSEG